MPNPSLDPPPSSHSWAAAPAPPAGSGTLRKGARERELGAEGWAAGAREGGEEWWVKGGLWRRRSGERAQRRGRLAQRALGVSLLRGPARRPDATAAASPPGAEPPGLNSRRSREPSGRAGGWAAAGAGLMPSSPATMRAGPGRPSPPGSPTLIRTRRPATPPPTAAPRRAACTRVSEPGSRRQNPLALGGRGHRREAGGMGGEGWTPGAAQSSREFGGRCGGKEGDRQELPDAGRLTDPGPGIGVDEGPLQRLS